jgi:hypothetical protein
VLRLAFDGFVSDERLPNVRCAAPGWRPAAKWWVKFSSGRRMRRLVSAVVTVVALSCGACTASSHGSSSSSPSASAPSVRPAACSSRQVRQSISRVFRAWNATDAAKLADLFTAEGELDFSTKDQNALRHRSDGYVAVASRSRIAIFAAGQWQLGERLEYRGMRLFSGSTVATSGAEVGHVVAHFADGTSQPFSEAKFHYDCRQQLIPHAVFVSASISK